MTSYGTTNENAVAGEFNVTPGAVCDSAEFQEKRNPPLAEESQMHPGDDCDCDSMSDGREKADTTPENLKKIDDVIERESLRSQFHNHPAIATNTNNKPMQHHDDDSNAKLEINTTPLFSANGELEVRYRKSAT